MATILFVDDDPDVLSIMGMALEGVGHNVLQASNGIAALDIMENQRGVDLLLTDVMMPGLNGFNLARMARARDPFLKILYLTGFHERSMTMKDHGDKLGKLLTKPILPEDLAKEIDIVLKESVHA